MTSVSIDSRSVDHHPLRSCGNRSTPITTGTAYRMKGMSAYDGNGAYWPRTSSYDSQITDAPAQVRQPRPTQLRRSCHGLERRPADQQQAAAIAGATTKARRQGPSRGYGLA